jgi:hypothetical protein
MNKIGDFKGYPTRYAAYVALLIGDRSTFLRVMTLFGDLDLNSQTERVQGHGSFCLRHPHAHYSRVNELFKPEPYYLG